MLVKVLHGHVNFAAYDGFEEFVAESLGLGFGFCSGSFVSFLAGFARGFLCLFYGILGLAVFLLYIIGELLYAVHCAVVGKCHAGHAVGYGLVDQTRDCGLAVEYGILRMYV